MSDSLISYLVGVIASFVFLVLIARDEEKFTPKEILTGMIFSVGSWVSFAFIVFMIMLDVSEKDV